VWQRPPDINFSQCDKSIFYKSFHYEKHSVTPMYHVNALWAKRALNVKPDGTHDKPLSFKRLKNIEYLSSKQVEI